MGVEVMLQQLLTMTSVVLLGFVGAKSKYLAYDMREQISKLILRISMPLLNLTVITSREFEQTLIKNAGILIVATICIIGILIIVGMITGRFLHQSPKRRAIYICMCAFGNVGFMGYPLMQALFGDIGLFYAVMYGLVHDLLFWNLGIFIIAKSGGCSSKGAFKKLLNPVTLSYPIALIMLCLGWQLPKAVHEGLSMVGSLTTPLALLFVGLTLATIDLKGIFKRGSIYLVIILKLLLMPALFALLLSALNLPAVIVNVIIFLTAIPTQSSLGIVAEEYVGSAAEYATESIFVTTILSLVTLPILYSFLQTL